MTNHKKELGERFRKAIDELTQLIEKFDYKSFNRKPTPDKWSAGEVTEHLLLFDILPNHVLEGAI